MDNETVHERMRTVWGGVADGWGAQSKAGDLGQVAATEWLLSRTDPRLGEVVLDLAGGAGVLRALIDAAGFDRSEFDELDFTIQFADDDAVWNLVASVNALLSPILRGLDDHERGEIRSAVVDAYAPWRGADNSFEVPGRVLAAFARW